ncbi:MAG: rhomboid family intramembrane serine protease [Planctomycetes bacterium]|nr:rhomboid family intramembrane serine protease [Planctomycetota bacterium]
MELLSRTQAMGLDWIQRGRGVASRELDGEVWRAITGLSLHLDLPHFLSNLAFGALFTLLVCELIGAGLGLSLIFASGALGNLLNSLLQPGEHASIGASTAVFAAPGPLGANGGAATNCARAASAAGPRCSPAPSCWRAWGSRPTPARPRCARWTTAPTPRASSPAPWRATGRACSACGSSRAPPCRPRPWCWRRCCSSWPGRSPSE